jgi:hypothetical protein
MKTSLLMLVLAASACSHFDAQPPKGFAVYDNGSSYRAASPDGVVYRVRSEDNEPQADLKFWSEALSKRMTEAGYILLNEEPVKAGSTDGHLLELAAPLGNRDYAYAVAVFVKDDDIIIVEAAGEVALMKDKRSDIVTAISQLAFK